MVRGFFNYDLFSATHTLRFQYYIAQTECVGVAKVVIIEISPGRKIWRHQVVENHLREPLKKPTINHDWKSFLFLFSIN